MHRFTRPALIAAFVTLVFLVAGRCPADVRLPHIFGDHMVIQQDLPVRVWGTADPGESVTVSIGENTASTTADAKGHWKLQLIALQAGKPVEIKVVGKNAITLQDVLVGEVWVCSGQSNMQMSVAQSTDGKEEVRNAKNLEIRLLTVPMRPSGEPAGDIDAEWKKCTSKNIPNFSAVAYFFGRHLQHELKVPIGLINTSWGGTRIEPWTPPVGFTTAPSLKPILFELNRLEAKYQAATAAAVDSYATWLAKAEAARASHAPIPAPPEWPAHPVKSHLTPTGLYNGMIHPIVPIGIRGAIWYQGESNLADGAAYADKMKALINGWRITWNEGEFPFYYMQLASFHYGNDKLPLVWEAQSSVLSVPKTGMAVINDISDLHDIHPKNKQDAGKRLALIALAKTYGKEGVVYSGPSYKAMKVEGNKVRLTLDHADGLASRDGKPLTWFTIAGEDKKFVDATAQIEGNAIVVSSPQVEKPVAVRFAWNQDAEPNLVNKEKLPASCFRTDSW